MADIPEKSVLSIQSTVVFGYVGNKSATFPLQVLGFDVSTVNSVQFSNHTGYKCFKGQVLNSDDLACLYDGLKENKISAFSHILTGYIGSKSFLEKVADIVLDLKKSNPSLLYVCDPVMGDNGKMYVPEELLPVYMEKILPIADIVTPNQFETEKLTGMKINSVEDAIKAMEILHNKGPKTVVISSSEFAADGAITSLASTVINGRKEVYKVQFEKIPAIFVGTGDLFAACLLAWLEKDKNLKVAFEKTISTLQCVIKRTLDRARVLTGDGNNPTPAQMELRLVQSKAEIENPPHSYTAAVL
ncbi:pyridoxal kinase-like isoform X2 [Ostrea edulis]|uniref:pyridoxal kinase-like isoform X2 n=1 Tax=Ostrea edulis TaxID=37623 RepID=UPI0020953044|nr:pyridoxal kinase-like isoform X2 [Ostrea edulis]